MPRQKTKEPKSRENSDNESDQQQMGISVGQRDYITLKKNKPKPLNPYQQNQQTVELFRNQELLKYMSEFQKEDKNQKKKTKNKAKQ